MKTKGIFNVFVFCQAFAINVGVILLYVKYNDISEKLTAFLMPFIIIIVAVLLFIDRKSVV